MKNEEPTHYSTILYPSEMEKLKTKLKEPQTKQALRKAVFMILKNEV